MAPIWLKLRSKCSEFEFCVIDEHGNETVETFPNGDALHARQLDFERRIKDEGWTGPHGWNI